MGYHKATGNSITEDPKISQIYDLLISGMSKKEIANRCSAPLDLVYTISKRYKTSQIKVNETEEVEREEKDEMEVIEKRNTKKLSDDTILQIWELYSNGTPLPRISEITGVSYSSVRKYVLEYKASYEEDSERDDTEKQLPESVKEDLLLVSVGGKKIEPDNTPVLRKIRCDAYLICGLVDGRHDMPTNKYIFDSVSKSNMFDYEFQEKKCKEFILENIPFVNRVAAKSLVVYVTGLQCVLAALIKVTAELKVNLVLNHFNSDNGGYVSQVIWNKFNLETPEGYKFVKRFRESPEHNLFTYDTSLDELLKLNDFYVISKYEVRGKGNVVSCDRVFVKDFNNLWSIYPTFVSQINANNNKCLAVNIFSVKKFNDGKYLFDDKICQAYNKKYRSEIN